MERNGECQFKDKTLVCLDCGRKFLFTAGEQFFFHGKGLAEPKRCPSCRRYRKLTIDPGPERGR